MKKKSLLPSRSMKLGKELSLRLVLAQLQSKLFRFLILTSKPDANIMISKKAIAMAENSGIEGCGVLAFSDVDEVAVAEVSGFDVESGEEVGAIVLVDVGVAEGVGVGVAVEEGVGCVEGVGAGVEVGGGVGVGVGSAEDCGVPIAYMVPLPAPM